MASPKFRTLSFVQLLSKGYHHVLSCSQIVHLPVEAVLVRVCPDVVVGAEAEGEVTLVVGSDVKHHGYYGALE